MGRDEGGVRRVAGTRPAPNGAAAVERRRAYALASSDYLACERAARAAGLDIVGFYHSHPEGPALPSAADERDAWPWYVYAIVSGDSVTCWLLAEDRGAFEKLTLRRAPPP
jgi:proteasome lid subunit RPN8/RPN11